MKINSWGQGLLERKRFFGRKKAAPCEAPSQLIDLGQMA